MKYAVPIGALIVIVGGITAYSVMQRGASMDTTSDEIAMRQVDTPSVADPSEDSMQEEESTRTIVETAVAAGSFTTLVAAVQAAGLVDVLNGSGPYTVFAPTDTAFAKLPAGTVESLLEDKEALTKVLTYHVVSGKVMAADVVKLTSAQTLQGQSVSVSTMGGVKINDATVITPDILASNGVIHVIDTVLLPPQ